MVEPCQCRYWNPAARAGGESDPPCSTRHDENTGFASFPPWRSAQPRQRLHRARQRRGAANIWRRSWIAAAATPKARSPASPNSALRLAGSTIGFGAPGLGIFYPPNLTSDPETGLGDWGEADIVKAVRTGERPDGRELAPMMPWRSYAVLTDEDALALPAYLKSLPPVRHAVPPPTGADEKAPAPYLGVLQ